LSLDVGGANLKAASSDGRALSIPFEVWRRPTELGSAIRAFTDLIPTFDHVTLTMTAELCDCFATKREGVVAVLDAVEQAIAGHPVSLLVWGIDGRFHRPEEIRARPLLAAAANWLALANAAARLVPEDRAILIDVGSTTTDLIPLDRGRVVARGRSDTERLRTGELVYAGVRRTPVCALATELGLEDGDPIGLAAELFATTIDVFLVLGDIEPDSTNQDTADGRPATFSAALDRLARMIGADRESLSDGDALALARAAERCLIDRLERAAIRACQATIQMPVVAVVSGSGEFLARRVAERVLAPGGRVLSLAESWGAAASIAACAHALIMLANQRNHF
jgi:probable H4MPT-linked C1 transfer pathway protein